MMYRVSIGIVLFLSFGEGLSISAQHVSDFAGIDKYARHVPKEYCRNIEELTSYLTRPYIEETDRVLSIYTWIVTNIKYDLKTTTSKNKSFNHNVYEVFEKRKAVCTGFANLFVYMTGLAGITSLPVSGYTKTASRTEVIPVQPDHVWNAVLIDNQWYLLDATWDAGYLRSSDKSQEGYRYFLINPAEFILDHLPAMPMWQLLDQPIGIESFIKGNILINNVAKTEGTFDFNKRIFAFLQLNPDLKRLFEYRATYKLHPTRENGKSMAHGLLDYAGILVDSIDSFDRVEENSSLLINLTSEVILLCEEAQEFTNFHDWQTRMYADALMSYVVYSYNAEIKKEEPDNALFLQLLNKLNKAHQLLLSVKEELWGRNARMECEHLRDAISAQIAGNK